MRSVIIKIVLPLCSALVLFSCTKKDDPTPSNPGNPGNSTTDPTGEGTVKLEFFDNVGSSKLNLNTQWYQNEHGDSFTVSKFNYYISNIKLNTASTSFSETESYHLLQADAASSMSFDLASVPAGVYKSVTFTIGVDSLRNVSGAQKGALDQANGMFWSWSTGYIMLKMEGTSPKSTASGNHIEFHAGGFSGENSVLRTVTLNFPNTITVGGSNTNHLHVTADVLALFKSPNTIDFAVMPLMNQAGPNAKKIADNYANMFTVTAAGI